MEEHEKLTDAAEHETDVMAERSKALEHEIEETRDEWEAKRRDSNVPGATPPPDETGDLDEGEVGKRGPAQAP